MRIVYYTPKTLLEFIDSEEYYTMPEIPISRHRAISHCNNPRVKEEDVILICIYDEDKLVGYLGLFADNFYPNNTDLHVGWMSCIWIDPAQRGKGIAKALVQQAIEKWNGNIIVTEFTETAKNVYMRSRLFDEWETKTGCRLYMRSPAAYILPQKNASLNKLKSLWKITDSVLNSVADLRFRFKETEDKNISFEYIKYVDAEAWQFIESKIEDNLCKRNRQDLNWIVNYPWILAAPEKDTLAKRYSFTATEKIFANCIIKVKNKEGKIIGILWLVRRNHFLKMPYMYSEKDYLPQLMQLLYRQMIEWKTSVFTTFNQEISEYLLSNPSTALYKKKITRQYLASKTISRELISSGKKMQDGDGDSAFT